MWPSDLAAASLTDAWQAFADYEQSRLQAWLDTAGLPDALRARALAALADPADDLAAWALSLADVDADCTDWLFDCGLFQQEVQHVLSDLPNDLPNDSPSLAPAGAPGAHPPAHT